MSCREENQKRIAGQIDELHSIAAEARSEVRAAHERITALDDYDVQESVTVNFSLNSAVLSAEAKQRLDALAGKAINARSYTFEVGGYTDSTGGEAVNFRLSRQRAEAVVQYLAVNHKIPLRRFVNPMGYGKTEAIANNSTAAGRSQNRRVEVKMLLNRGMNQFLSQAHRPSHNNPAICGKEPGIVEQAPHPRCPEHSVGQQNT